MEPLSVFFIVAGIASIAGVIAIPVSIGAWRSGNRKKTLAFEVSRPVALATLLTVGTEHTFSLSYERSGDPTEIKGAYIHFLRLANLGKETIRRVDLETSDPFRIEVDGSKVLDIALAGVTRNVNGLSLGKLKDRGTPAKSFISFDFLDHKDGALIRILTEEPTSRIRLRGTVIGIPEEFVRIQGAEGSPTVSGWGCGALLLADLLAVALAAYASAAAFGEDFSWGSVWLVLIPLTTALAFGVLVLLTALVWPSRKLWPEAIEFPTWFTIRSRYFRSMSRPYEWDANDSEEGS